VTGDARPAAADAAARQAADLDPPAGAGLPGRAGPVSPGPARARWNRGRPGWLGVARGHPLGTGNLGPRDQGAHVDGHLHGRINHTGGVDHLEATQHGTDVDHLKDHRDLGQLPEHDHPAVRLSAHPRPGRAPERYSPCRSCRVFRELGGGRAFGAPDGDLSDDRPEPLLGQRVDQRGRDPDPDKERRRESSSFADPGRWREMAWSTCAWLPSGDRRWLEDHAGCQRRWAWYRGRSSRR
jgi:hypothetical protein